MGLTVSLITPFFVTRSEIAKVATRLRRVRGPIECTNVVFRVRLGKFFLTADPTVVC